ncbi:PDZ domain-containing protein [Radiobacillus sp. PE A8.2]|uniref:PDZ domain-containing protein n=1 Tax=Radiobacillus sp. PE A8.2 TaxID=3380349 RepID=UPI00388FB155
MEVWLIEVLKGLGRLFINPLLYWFLIITFLASLARIKQERKYFGTKIFNVFSEWRNMWTTSLLSGLFISIVAISIGIVLQYQLLLLLFIALLLLSLTRKFTMLSPAYSIGISVIILLLLPLMSNFLPSSWLVPFDQVNVSGYAIILGILLITEALLLLRVKRNDTFPELMKSGRGRWVAQHRIKRIALIPFFTVIPIGDIEPFASWWPVFTINAENYGLVLIPFLIGFDMVARGTIPLKLTHRLSQSILILGMSTVGLGVVSIYIPYVAIATIAVVLVVRIIISIRLRTAEQQKQPSYTPDPKGLIILGVIQGSPAERLGLLIGERLEKVNGQLVRTEPEFYKALQINSAFCKLEVRDDRGEIRFAQRAMYQGEHHELGIIFAKEDYLVRK